MRVLSKEVFIPHDHGRPAFPGFISYISGTKAQGNWPRSPLLIAEIQKEPFALKRETVTAIDQRHPGESPVRTQSVCLTYDRGSVRSRLRSQSFEI